MISCYIIDDEQHAVNLLSTFVQQTPGLVIAGTSTNPLVALNELSSATPPDIVFLDIDMPELSGLAMAGLLHHGSAVVITTSFREYGPEAFENHVSDYLLKPVSYERFLSCIHKIRSQLNTKRTDATDGFFFVKEGTKGKTLKVPIGLITHISAFSNYIEIHLPDKRVLAYLTMSEVLDKLPPDTFSRVHRSYIINHRYVEVIEPGQIRLENLAVIPMGRAYRPEFMNKLGPAFLVSRRE